MALAKGGGNPFYSPDDDIDDDAFLNHPRAGSSGYMLPQHSRPSSVMSLEERQRQILMKKREIEEETLKSSDRSLGLLFESEKVGAATAEELGRQKETLLRTEGRLDEINHTLKTSERHLNGIKSVFGGIKNYLFAKNSGLPSGGSQSGSSTMSGPTKMPQSNSDVAIGGRVNNYQPPSQDPRMESLREETHPALRQRGLVEPDAKRSVDDVLDDNLDQMAQGLSRLKGLAIDLNAELDDHDEILDRIEDKASHAGIKVNKQNKDMSKLLGGKKK